MTQKEIMSLFPITVEILDFHRDLANAIGGAHKIGITLLATVLPKELHEDIFWGLSIGTVDGVKIKTVHKEYLNGKQVKVPLYLDSNFKGDKVKFELR